MYVPSPRRSSVRRQVAVIVPTRQTSSARIGPPHRRLSRAVARPTARADGTPFTPQPVRPTNRRNTPLEGPAYAHYAQLRRWEETPLQFKEASSPPLIGRQQAVEFRAKHNILVSFPISYLFPATNARFYSPQSLASRASCYVSEIDALLAPLARTADRATSANHTRTHVRSSRRPTNGLPWQRYVTSWEGPRSRVSPPLYDPLFFVNTLLSRSAGLFCDAEPSLHHRGIDRLS